MAGNVWEQRMIKHWKGDILFILVIGALIGGWMYLYPRPGESPLVPLDPSPALSVEDLPSFASLEGLKLAYRHYAPRDGEPECVIVFLHDTLLHSGWYGPLGEGLAREGVAAYLPDRRGWGHSAGDRLDEEPGDDLLIQDITAMISVAQAQYPQKPIYLGGHGRGAGLALRYVASGRPVAGLVLLAPYISDDQPNLRPEGWAELIVAHPGEALLARAGLTQWRVWNYCWPASMVEADSLIESAFSIAYAEQTVPDDLGRAYQSARMPVLCVLGSADPLFHVEKTGGLLDRFAAQDRQLEAVPDVGYLTVIDAAANPIAHWLEGR
jgi:alpha-beta hydrolase superfamily lysophospholipase